MDITFFVFVVIATFQIVLFSIYLAKINNWSKQEKNTEIIDIIPVCNYNGKTYWLEKDCLYRENISVVTMDTNKAERIDQLNAKDLSPSEIIYILNLLEEAK
jgi:hypothetical protein